MRNRYVFRAVIVSLIVAGFAVLYHFTKVSPHNWNAVAMWLPVYISPIWAISGISWLSERKKVNGNNKHSQS